MADLAEIERRITAALDRVSRVIEAVRVSRVIEAQAATARPEAAVSGHGDAGGGRDAATDGSRAELEARLVAAFAREKELCRDYDERLARMNRQLDAQGQELHRMRQAASALRNELHRLREAKTGELDVPGRIDTAMRAELSAIEAGRHADAAELDEIMTALAEHLSAAEAARGEGAGGEHA